MIGRVALVAGALLLLISSRLAAAPPPRLVKQGQALMARFECHRCHEGTGLAAPPRDKRCVGCHREILAGKTSDPPGVVKTWQRHLVSLRQAPSLAGAGERFSRDWMVRFLLDPEDLRPGLRASMPRLRMTAAEARAIAAALEVRPVARGRTAAPQGPAALPTAAQLEEGRVLYARLQCATCHRFTGAVVDDPATTPAALPPPDEVTPTSPGSAPVARADSDGLALAPDLSVTRRRFRRERLAQWIRDPRAVQPEAQMPTYPLDAAQAARLADFVLHTPLRPAAALPLPPRLPLLSRPVSFDEVSARVFRQVCWHCHSQSDLALGDGGPGNTGGFGFAPRGVDLSTYAGVAAGAIGDDRQRQSLFRPLQTGPLKGTPRLVAHLLARQAEEAGRPFPGGEKILGMPLGFPALSSAQIQLVESWVAQGRPR